MATIIYCPKCQASIEAEESALADGLLCQTCGHDFTAAAALKRRITPARRIAPASSPASAFGIVLIVIGVLAFVYFAFFFDTSVQTSAGMAVTNLELSNDRLIGVIAGAVIAVVGTLVATRRSR